MCGRIYIKSTLGDMLRNFTFAASERVEGLANQFPRCNGAPSLITRSSSVMWSESPISPAPPSSVRAGA